MTFQVPGAHPEVHRTRRLRHSRAGRTRRSARGLSSADGRPGDLGGGARPLRHMNRWSWLLVIFGCLALLVSLGDWKHIEVSAERTARRRPANPTSTWRRPTITQYGDDGTVRYRLLSSEVRHYEDERITRLAAPTMTLYRAPQPPWFARSNEGLVHDTDTADGKARRGDSAAGRRTSGAARAESHRNHDARRYTSTPIANSPRPTNLLSSTPHPDARTRSECPVISTPVSSSCRRAPPKGFIPLFCQVSSNVQRRSRT